MRTLILLILLVVLVILLIPLLLFCYLTRMFQPLIVMGKFVIWLCQKVLGIRIEVQGLDKIHKKTSYVFMANHESFLDGPMLFMLIRNPLRVLLKKEAFRIPVIGMGMKYVGFIPVDRNKLRGGKQSIDQAVRMMKEKGYSYLIFPEGTRTRDGKLQPFKRGGFFLAVDTQAPIVPVSIRGTFKLMPRGKFFIKKGKVKVIFHEPVRVDNFGRSNLQDLSDKIRNIIQSGLN